MFASPDGSSPAWCGGGAELWEEKPTSAPTSMALGALCSVLAAPGAAALAARRQMRPVGGSGGGGLALQVGSSTGVSPCRSAILGLLL